MKYKLLNSWSTTPSIEFGLRENNSKFCFEVEFDISIEEKGDGYVSFWFLYCNVGGLNEYIENNFYFDKGYYELNNIILSKEFSISQIDEIIKGIKDKIKGIDNISDLLFYLNSNFSFVEN